MSVVVLGALAVFAYRYRDEAHRSAVAAGTVSPGSAVEGLSVSLPAHGRAATWHDRTGLYGFTGVLDGPQLVHIRDPSRRFVPRTFEVDVSSRAAIADALVRRAVQPPSAPPATVVAVPVRAAHGHPWSSGQTVFRGSVTEVHRGRRVPAPFARVEAHRSGALTHVVHADETGRFALWLFNETEPLSGSPPDVEFRAQARLQRPRPDRHPLAGQPGGFDTLSAGDIASLYGPLMPPVTRPVTVGETSTLTLDLP